MPPALLGTSYDKRLVGKLPPVRLINRYVESAPVNQINGVAILPRPGLVTADEVGAGPQRGVYREPGLFGGDLFNVSLDILYRDGTAVPFAMGIAEIEGTDLIRWAGTDLVESLFFCAGGVLYLYDGTEVSEVTVPDAQQCTDVAEINGYILVQVAGSGRRYFIRPGEVVIDPLDYFTAESSPDPAVATVTTASDVWLFDSKSCEPWFPTGNSDAPFQRDASRIASRGATSRDCVMLFDNTVFFVGEDSDQGRIAYRLASVPQRISTTSIEEKFRLSGADFTAIGFILDGHAFYIVSCDQGSFGYDVSSNAWAQWASYGRDRFRAHVAVATAGYPVVLGDDTDARLYNLDPTIGNDDGEPIQRVVGGGMPTITRQTVDKLWLQCNTGYSSDPDYMPIINARFSRDGGFTWTDEKQASLGQTGQYNKRVIWNRCGQFVSPGVLFEIIDSDNVQTTLQYATVNEAY